ncbi:MAG: nitroreductase family protein [Alcanivoracaceae bacterium]|nr:nitroreductase family protein [Alcanivoracaceae bacterium]
MEFSSVLASRNSVRAFKDTAVPEALLEALLGQALQAPSWSNTQPYHVAVARGPVLADLREALGERFRRASKLSRAPWYAKLLAPFSGALPDGDFKPILKYPDDLQPRRVATGKGLYRHLGIAREDHAARDAQMARNFAFFDAPVAMFLFVHKGLGHYSTLDAGIFLQSLMLAATDAGLGTCAQGALALWRSPVEKHFRIPAPYKLLCGLSLGYPADDPVNQFRPQRISVEQLCLPPRQARGNDQ